MTQKIANGTGSKVPKRATSLEEAIELTGFGIFHFIIVAVAGGALMCVIIETMAMMYVMPAAQCDLNLTLTTKGLLQACSYLGVFLGSHTWGYLLDTKGRRYVIMLSLSLSALTSLIGCLIPWDWVFILLRLMNGMFIGGASAGVYSYVGEFFPQHKRASSVTWMSTFVGLGLLFLPSSAWIVLPMEWSLDIWITTFKPWRLLLVINSIPSILVTIFLYNLPETPRFLMVKHRVDETYNVLKKMYAINHRQPYDNYPVSEVLHESYDADCEKKIGLLTSIWRQTVPLFKFPYIWRTLMVSYLQFGVFVFSSGLMMWYPQLLIKMSNYEHHHINATLGFCTVFGKHFKSLPVYVFRTSDFESGEVELDEIDCEEDPVKEDIFKILIVLSICFLFLFIFIGVAIKKFGKKSLMIGIFSVSTVAGLAAQFVHGYTLLQLLIGIFLMANVGISLTNAMAVDLFPTSLRGMAIALSLMCGRIGAAVGSNSVGHMLSGICSYFFFIGALNNIFIILVTILLPKPIKE